MAESELVLPAVSANSSVLVECIINEVLFVLSNKFYKFPKANLISLLSTFFSVELSHVKSVFLH